MLSSPYPAQQNQHFHHPTRPLVEICLGRLLWKAFQIILINRFLGSIMTEKRSLHNWTKRPTSNLFWTDLQCQIASLGRLYHPPTSLLYWHLTMSVSKLLACLINSWWAVCNGFQVWHVLTSLMPYAFVPASMRNGQLPIGRRPSTSWGTWRALCSTPAATPTPHMYRPTYMFSQMLTSPSASRPDGLLSGVFGPWTGDWLLGTASVKCGGSVYCRSQMYGGFWSLSSLIVGQRFSPWHFFLPPLLTPFMSIALRPFQLCLKTLWQINWNILTELITTSGITSSQHIFKSFMVLHPVWYPIFWPNLSAECFSHVLLLKMVWIEFHSSPFLLHTHFLQIPTSFSFELRFSSSIFCFVSFSHLLFCSGTGDVKFYMFSMCEKCLCFTFPDRIRYRHIELPYSMLSQY